MFMIMMMMMMMMTLRDGKYFKKLKNHYHFFKQTIIV